MAILSDAFSRPHGTRSLSAALDLQSSPEDAFALVCAVEKWPVWASFIRSAELRGSSAPLAPGSEVLVRSTIPGELEQLFEVDVYMANHHLSLVGAYSLRRRLDFRIERKTSRSKLHVRIDYPTYGGKFGAASDALGTGRKLGSLLEESLIHFRGLVEFQNHQGAVLDDF
ncbi:MAG: hypothetical protein JO165_06495 [Candidatus Eremiobacteraeota bacterium]|nr:hypothetical protein [Candidatus Eremiobacteraeota bacterium]